MALRAMGIEFDHLFSSEVHPRYRAVLQATHPDIMTVFSDVTKRTPRELQPFKGRVTCYTSGFPCQPFSAMGSRAGAADERGTVVWSVLGAIVEILPDVFILENVKTFATSSKFQEHFKATLDVLGAIGGGIYIVDWRILDSHDFRVPARRERLYVVGVRRDRQREAWAWPGPLTPVSLSTILDPVTPGTQFPRTSATAIRNINKGIDKIVAKHPNVNPTSQPWVIDACSSPKFGVNVSLDKLPTVTRARGRQCGYFLLQHQRFITEDELLRAQGFRPADIKLPMHTVMPKNIRAEMSGNAFTVPVFQCLLKMLLPAIGIDV